MKHSWTFTAGLPQLDIHTLSEDWALGASIEVHWRLMADSLGRKPSEWIDSQGDRMYGAVMRLTTGFDLEDTIHEDDTVTAVCEIIAVRKPHALSLTTFSVGGKVKARTELLTSFIKRKVKGSNKKFAKTRELWDAPDFEGDRIDDLLDAHHAMKSAPEVGGAGSSAHRIEVNRIRDFNMADFLYFKNFVQFAKAAEWAHGRGGPTRLNAERECWYYGNVEDGDIIETRVAEPEAGLLVAAHHAPDGRRIFYSQTRVTPVTIAPR